MKFVILLAVIAVASATNTTAPYAERRALMLSENKYRADGRCGANFPAPNGDSFSECNPHFEGHCCSEWGWCGNTAAHCDCPDCVDYRNWRDDGRCGPEFPAPNGDAVSECNALGAGPCCSPHGWCGDSDAHCICDGCVDYQTESYRVDQRCGPGFPAPNGEPSSTCNPDGPGYCCSQWGWCGDSSAHCDCPDCINYKELVDYRQDGRCGNGFPAPDGSGNAKCNPASDAPCCSNWGWCGNTADHCYCDDCIYYK